MSQKTQADGAQKHFAVGRGLLAAAETLNFNMNEQRPNRPVGVGVGMEGLDGSGQMPQCGGSTSNLGSTMKLFASLGLSPSDLDALAEIPEEEISVETLPHILRQLKSRKGEAGERRAAMSSDAAYRGGSWEEGHVGRMGVSSLGQGSAKSSTDFGYSSLQDVSSSRGYGLNYSGGGGGGSRERPYSELSHRSGLGMGPSEPVFMQRRMGSPSNGKVQDFLGVMPPMFPHVCSLCDFDVHSTMVSTSNLLNDGCFCVRLCVQAFIQLATVEDAEMLVKHYTQNPLVFNGRIVRLNICTKYKTLNSEAPEAAEGDLPEEEVTHLLCPSIPNSKYTDEEVLKLAEPYGRVKKYFLNRIRRECFLEMYNAEDAEKMAADYKAKPLRFSGKRLTLYVSRKYKQLKHGLRVPNTKKRASESPPLKSSHDSEEPPGKKPKEEVKPEEEEKKEEEVQSCEVSGEETVMDENLGAEKLKDSEDVSCLYSSLLKRSIKDDFESFARSSSGSRQKKLAVIIVIVTISGVEHVKAGFYCRICFLFYSNEDTAKKMHCSSQAHYNKLQWNQHINGLRHAENRRQLLDM
uniref:Matrin 3-like 1.1 n=1 Tax=Neolamprologus brichardi TaxID=32507 RepID=A0A3Q4HAX6_NEOBR